MRRAVSPTASRKDLAQTMPVTASSVLRGEYRERSA